MHPDRRAYRLGILLALLAPVLWSSSGVFVKALQLEPLPLAGLRALIAGLALAPFLRLRQVRPGPALAVLLLAYTASVFAFVQATKLTTAANVIALVSTAPAWVLLLTWAAARRVVWSQAGPVGIMLAGVAVLLLEPHGGGAADTQGNLLGLMGGITFGVFTFLVPRVRLSPVGLVSLCNLAAAVLLVLASPAAYRLAEISGLQWLALLYLGVVQIGVATVCFAAALQRIPATHASMLALLELLLNPVWVFLLLREAPSGYGYAGLALILGGVMADAWTRRGPALAGAVDRGAVAREEPTSPRTPAPPRRR